MELWQGDVRGMAEALVKANQRAEKYKEALLTIKENVERLLRDEGHDAYLKHCILSAIEMVMK